MTLTPEKRETLEKLACALQKRIEEYFASWQKPMKYRFAMNMFSPKLPKGMPLDEFTAFVTEHSYVQVKLAPSGRRFVFPSQEFLSTYGCDEDVMLESLIETDEMVTKDAVRIRKEVRENKI